MIYVLLFVELHTQPHKAWDNLELKNDTSGNITLHNASLVQGGHNSIYNILSGEQWYNYYSYKAFCLSSKQSADQPQ